MPVIRRSPRHQSILIPEVGSLGEETIRLLAESDLFSTCHIGFQINLVEKHATAFRPNWFLILPREDLFFVTLPHIPPLPNILQKTMLDFYAIH